MLDQDLIDMLDSDDPDDRLFAVKAMAKSKDPEYLQYLAIVYRTDNDPDVKEMALKAGKYIKKTAAEDNWTGGDAVYSDDDDDDEIEVSSRAKEQAQSYLNQASDLSFSGNNEKASEMLRKAVQTNPNLKNDDYAKSLASTITGFSSDLAIGFILSEESQPKEKSKRGGGTGDAGWGEAAIDLAIFWLVAGGSLTVMMLLAIRGVANADMSTASSFEGAAELQAAISGLSLIFVLLVGFGISFAYTIYLVINSAVIHFAATSMFAGDGTMPGMIHKTIYYNIITTVVTIVMVGLVMVDPGSMEGNSSNPLISMIMLAASIGLFLSVFWYGALIGQNYDFGMGKGCASIIAGGILLGILNCICSFLVQAAGVSSMATSTGF